MPIRSYLRVRGRSLGVATWAFVAPEQVSQLAVEFGSHYGTATKATTALKRVTGLGFVQAHVDQVGCANYRIVETGVTDETVGNSIISEARTSTRASSTADRLARPRNEAQRVPSAASHVVGTPRRA